MDDQLNEPTADAVDFQTQLNLIQSQNSIGHNLVPPPVTSDSITVNEQISNVSKVSQARRKLLRNTGMEYTSTSGKLVPKRTVRELEDCRNKCKEKISIDQQTEIFNHYWQVSSYVARQTFASELIEIEETKTERKRKSLTNPKHRPYAYKYFLKIKEERIQVCQKCFLCTLCESEQFVKTLVKKKLESTGEFSGNDERGKHSKRSAEKETELINMINDFVMKKPKTTNETGSLNELQISKSYKIQFEKIGSLEVLTRKRVYKRQHRKKK